MLFMSLILYNCIHLNDFQGPLRDDLFDELDDFGTDTATDELEEYLNTPTINTKGLEPLAWWYAIGESNPLARMAIDFLSAPGKPLIL